MRINTNYFIRFSSVNMSLYVINIKNILINYDGINGFLIKRYLLFFNYAYNEKGLKDSLINYSKSTFVNTTGNFSDACNDIS